MRRVAVTGLGVVSPVGNSAEEFFDGLIAGRSGVKRITADFAAGLGVKVAASSDFNGEGHFTKKQLGYLDRTSQMALAAAEEAWNASGPALSDEERLRAGVCMGTGMGGAHSLDELFVRLYRTGASRVSPLSVPRIMSNAPASHISIRFGLGGPCHTFSTACSSSAVAVGEAFRLVKAGYADIMLAGGAESLITYGSLKCWESLGVLAPEDRDDPAASCRPFSRDRAGFVLGEGAAVVVLEDLERARRRGATVFAELAGYGSTADALHITNPSPDGQARAMALALTEAGVLPEELGYINAHGTATISNDLAETQAVKKVFGERAGTIPISSTKSLHGHLLGAAGAVEFAASVLALQRKALPPTAHLRVADPECDLDYIANAARTGVQVRAVMSNSFAFGGTNAVLVAKEAGRD